MRQFLASLWSHVNPARTPSVAQAVRGTRMPAAIEHQRERRALAVAGAGTASTQSHAPCAEFAVTEPVSTLMVKDSQRSRASHHRPRNARASWMTFDPQDMRRTVIAGRMSEVCAVLEQLTLMCERPGLPPR